MTQNEINVEHEEHRTNWIDTKGLFVVELRLPYETVPRPPLPGPGGPERGGGRLETPCVRHHVVAVEQEAEQEIY